jgi:4-amino-4-deoxy-L-arabinose transferase-like glycosyltransferase
MQKITLKRMVLQTSLSEAKAYSNLKRKVVKYYGLFIQEKERGWHEYKGTYDKNSFLIQRIVVSGRGRIMPEIQVKFEQEEKRTLISLTFQLNILYLIAPLLISLFFVLFITIMPSNKLLLLTLLLFLILILCFQTMYEINKGKKDMMRILEARILVK